MPMKTLDKVALVLVMIGGINWGIVGLWEKDLVGEIFGYGSATSRVIFVVIGAAAVYLAFNMAKMMNAKTSK